MITAIKDSNVEAYKLLFEEASDILSGYERVQTFDTEKEYYYKDSLDKVNPFKSVSFADVEEFADGLVKYTILYTPVLNADGTKKEPPKNFSTAIGITSLEEYYNWLPEIKSKSVVDKDSKTVLVPTKYTILPFYYFPIPPFVI